MGHALMGGGIAPASSVADPLNARGVVLLGGDAPLVVVSVDWCEIRNDAYARWCEALAAAARTEPECVLVTSVHQHDAPVADLEAERLLRERRLAASVCDPEFHERAVTRVAAEVARSVKSAQAVTHFGVGQARVEGVASNRRYRAPDGTLRFDRTSATRDPVASAAELGTIDPWLKSLSFWNNDKPLAVIHAYATHPMSYYGRGEVSADFVGLARRRREQDDPSVHHIYVSGASGNVTAGKFNDGSAANRQVLSERIYQGMCRAWQETQRHRLDKLSLVSTDLKLMPRTTPGFTAADLERRLAEEARPFEHCLAAMGLSRLRFADRGLRLSAIDFGSAKFALLPGESYVEFQLQAQSLAPDDFVVVAGYGECATGYVPIEQAWLEGDANLRDWCWVDPGAEAVMLAALAHVLRR
jgi:hypothetical protein